MSSPTRSATTSRTSKARSTARSSAQASSGEAQGNQIQVGVELQADCYAGVWAARKSRALLEPGDIEEGMRAAEAIGDDTLQKQTPGPRGPGKLHPRQLGAAQEALQRGLQERQPGAAAITPR